MHVTAGSTTRLWVEFRDLEGELVDPEEVELSVRDHHRRDLETQPTPQRVSLGRWEADYTLPEHEALIEYEWRGTLGGYPEVARGRLEVRR